MNTELDTLCYIQEQTSFEDDYNGKFGYKVTDLGSRFYVTFPAVLQTFGDKNRNGRRYNQNNIWNCIQTDEYIQDMLKHNSWMGEIDHPNANKLGEELTLQRISNPDMTRTSHYIRSPKMNGNRLEGNIQTDSSNKHGMNMAIKIVDGKIVPCFSARVLGSKKPSSDEVWVKKLVCYDWVLYPSHKGAKAQINQPLMESVNALESFANSRIIFLPELAKMTGGKSDSVKMLCEAFQLTEDDIIGVTESGNSVVVGDDKGIYVQPITESQLRNKTKSALNDWINS